MNWNELEPQTNALKANLIQIIETIQDNSVENLPQPDPTLNLSLDLLKNPSYDIVVCGEIKKGKSTFINAIVGQDILPTNTQVATSQVFRITNSETESYELVFIDGTRQAITREELAKYGSQVEINSNDEAQFINSKPLDYIQVNIPVEFLPQGVTIVDTPGLGSLYADHEQITNRYVQNAAAVIFIFDPERPMVQQEEKFLEKIFDITPYVMFVMTKRDCYTEAVATDIIRRNEDLLKVFESKCYTAPQIFPVSSVTLSKAGKQTNATTKDKLYNASQFPEMKEELLRMIYKTVGLSRNTFAFSEAGKQYKKVSSSINEQITMVSENDTKEQEEIKQKRKKLNDWFNDRWGTKSETRKKVLEKINELCIGTQNRGQEIVSQSSEMYRRFQSEIDSIGTIQDAQSFADGLPGRLKADISSRWQNLTISSSDKLKQILVEFKTDMEQELISKRSSDEIPLSSHIELMKLTDKDKFDCFRGSYLGAGMTVGIGTFILNAVGIALGPVGWVIVGVASIIAGLWGGGARIRERELNTAKTQLRNGLQTAFAQIRDWLFVRPVDGEEYTPIQKLQKEIRNMGEKALIEVYEAQSTEFKQEDERLAQQQKMNSAQKQAEKVKLTNQQKTWNGIGLELQTIQSDLENIIEALN